MADFIPHSVVDELVPKLSIYRAKLYAFLVPPL